MRLFAIGDVCRFLDVKPHVLRYWEQEFPLLAPRKERTGRRQYTLGDIQILFRIKYLLYTRRFTVEGARRKIWEELSGGGADLKARLQAVRSELLETVVLLREQRERFGSRGTP